MSPLRKFVRSAFALEDIEGLIALGAPVDEYDAEADKIASTLSGRDVSEAELQNLILSVWGLSFELDDIELGKRVPAIQHLASQITEHLSQAA